MVVIRLSRGGSKARPFYSIVVADKRVRRDGRFMATWTPWWAAAWLTSDFPMASR